MDELAGNRIKVFTGDITKLEVDAIVNAANSSLLGGGGVDGAIHRAAGTKLLVECKRLRHTQYPDGLPTGQAAITGGAHLPAKHVIHTVGPIWHGGDHSEEHLLRSAYTNSLELATANQVRTVAFPAISTGVYGYPKELAAKVAFRAVSEYLASHDLPVTVMMVFFSDADRQAFLRAVEE